jgi:hypothetical protein
MKNTLPLVIMMSSIVFSIASPAKEILPDHVSCKIIAASINKVQAYQPSFVIARKQYKYWKITEKVFAEEVEEVASSHWQLVELPMGRRYSGFSSHLCFGQRARISLRTLAASDFQGVLSSEDFLLADFETGIGAHVVDLDMLATGHL